MIKANPILTKEYILTYLSQEEIMEKYLGVSIGYGMFCSPLRKDNHPTCSYSWYKGILYFRDWALDRPMDCFNVVQHLYNVNFHEALKIIASDFDLIQNVQLGKLNPINNPIDENKGSERKSIIQVKLQKLTEDNINYLKSYHLTKTIINKFKVFSPEYVWVNGKIIYHYEDSNPALAYYFGKDDLGHDKWKIYFYKKRDGYRFITNTNRINGWIQIPERDNILVITKSLKDVMCLDIYGVSSIAMQAESQTPYDYIIETLKRRFDRIVTLFDYDDTGRKRAKVIRETYNIPSKFISPDKAKDFSDYIKKYGVEAGGELLTKMLYATNS